MKKYADERNQRPWREKLKFEQSMETNIIRFTIISKFIHRFGVSAKYLHDNLDTDNIGLYL